MRYLIGVDPDLHHTGLALLNGDTGAVLDVLCITANGKTREDAVVAMVHALDVPWFIDHDLDDMGIVVVVEAQELYLGGGTQNPRNIMHLAQVAGAALAAAACQFRRTVLHFPRPAEWKGQVPKRVHQHKTLGKLGWEHKQVGTDQRGYCYPTIGNGDVARPPLPKTQWKHVVDAIGLALWGMEKRDRVMSMPST